MVFTIGVEGVFGWKSGCKKLLRLGSESEIPSDVSSAGLFNWKLLLKNVWVESSESTCSDLDEKLGLKTDKGKRRGLRRI